MSAPLQSSDVPFKPNRLASLLKPAIFASNLTLAAWIYPAWRTAQVNWDPDSASLIDLLQNRTRPLICYGWHAYELLMFCAFRPFPRRLLPTAIAHDGVLSCALQQSGTWYGFPVWTYHRKSPLRPKQQLINLLANTKKTIGLFCDAGGPDGRVKPGIVEIARETGAELVPVSVQASKVLRFPGPRRYLFPLPYAKMVAYHGEPLDGRSCTLDQCQGALERLEQRMQQDSL